MNNTRNFYKKQLLECKTSLIGRTDEKSAIACIVKDQDTNYIQVTQAFDNRLFSLKPVLMEW